MFFDVLLLLFRITCAIHALQRILHARPQINVQRDKAVGVQQVPGGYFLSRHIDNIYRAVKNDGDDVRQTVLEYTDVINAELTRKRKEFGLETAE